MDIFRDHMYRLTPEKALDILDQYQAQRDYEKEKLEKLKQRRARIVKKLDTDIAKLEEDLANTESVIAVIKSTHFEAPLEGGDI
jgi:hypothetical protein